MVKERKDFIYFSFMQTPNPGIEWSTRIKAKERQARRAKEEKGKSVDVLVGDGEQRKKVSQGAEPQPSYSGPFGLFLRPAWIINWAYSEAPQLSRGELYIYLLYITSSGHRGIDTHHATK